MTHAEPSIDRRRTLRALGTVGAALSAPWPALHALAASPSPDGALAAAATPTGVPPSSPTALVATSAARSDAAAFDAAVASSPRLTPFKGVADDGPGSSDLRCDALALSGRWPAALVGRFWRNGPAVFERAGQRYRHWFDGDGMVQRFAFDGRRIAHVGRLVGTPKLVAERAAGRFVYPAFGTAIDGGEVTLQGPDAMNVANTNALEHAGRLLAMWEGGSAFDVDPRDLSTRGAIAWRDDLAQMPFSAHPKVDEGGDLWNIGTFADKLVVWHVDARGRLASVQTRTSPYPHGMAHDVAVTRRHIVLPLPPVRMDYRAIREGAAPEQAFVYDRRDALRVLVMRKDDVADARVFELPARFVFHVGNAYERADGSIALSFVGAADADFLVRGALDLVAGRPAHEVSRTSLHTAVLDLASGRASVESMDDSIEFPRVDPRRVGLPARLVASVAAWRGDRRVRGGLFHGVQVRDLASGRVDRFDYGDQAVVEEHVVVPKPHARGERDAWLLGTSFDARRQRTFVNLLDAAHVADGPIARAELPYRLPFGFHGNFTAA